MSTKGQLVLGGLELGGTTIKCAIALDHPTNVIVQKSFPTNDPDSTLNQAYKFFEGYKIASLGVGSFGPVDLNPRSKTYGFITSTPKSGWQDCDVLGRFKKLGVPTGFQTDVNAAAMGEYAHGNHGAIDSCVYVTVGTGIGAGIIINGQPLSGLMHPEAGHILVARHPQDAYAGHCPFHKDCLEGLANARAVADRCNVHPSALSSIPDSHPVWDIEAFYLAQLCSSLAMTVSPHVIILGGGVLKRSILFPKIRTTLVKLLNGYLRVPRIIDETDKFVVSSRFEVEDSKTSAGCVGVLELARQVASRSKL